MLRKQLCMCNILIAVQLEATIIASGFYDILTYRFILNLRVLNQITHKHMHRQYFNQKK